MNWLLSVCCGRETPQPKKPIVPKQLKLAPSKVPQQIQQPSPALKRQSSSFCDLGKLVKGDRYEGEEMAGFPHGNGSMLYANGDFYRGEWVNGHKEGRGLQIYQQLNAQYDGQWQQDHHCGAGKFTQANSSYYIGQFKNGKKHGKGVYYDNQKKKQYHEIYSNGDLREQKQIILSRSKEQEFPTLVLDKQRFNSDDLCRFEEDNERIKQLDVQSLLKYYSLCKIISLEFIQKHLKEWSVKEVLNFLDVSNLKSYKQIFYSNKIKGKDLLTLTERELKDDLRMKMGDRKKLLNYVEFLSDVEPKSIKQSVQSRGDKRRKSQSYKLRSASSMRKVLRTVKNYGMYEQSIAEEPSQSEQQSQQFHTNRLVKVQLKYSPKQRQYGSAAIQQRYSMNNSQQKQSSLEKLIAPHSERSSNHSSSKQRDQMMRKESKDYDAAMQAMQAKQTNYNKSGLQAAKNTDKNGDMYQRHSQDQGNKREDAVDDYRSSTSTSSEEALDLHRKKTFDKSSQSEIRQLYEFLKEHRGLDFLIRQKDIQVIELIGEGGYGKVYKGKYVGQLIAIKDYLKTGKHRHKQDFMKQLQIISTLKHPNIVLYMGLCITASKYTLITQFLENGSLFDQIHKKKRKFNSEEQVDILYDIVKGMVYLHDMKKILHRDLKSSNVLIGDKLEVKLCDFGLSGQKKKRCKKSKNRVGTYQWMAPEVIRNEKIDQFADVYSFGVIIWELLTQKIPYAGLSEQQIIGLVGYDQQHQLQDPKNGCSFLKEIMKKCLMRDPTHRPSFMDIQSDFQSYYANQKQREKDRS